MGRRVCSCGAGNELAIVTLHSWNTAQPGNTNARSEGTSCETISTTHEPRSREISGMKRLLGALLLSACACVPLSARDVGQHLIVIGVDEVDLPELSTCRWSQGLTAVDTSTPDR
jgi:hypothetical protein